MGKKNFAIVHFKYMCGKMEKINNGYNSGKLEDILKVIEKDMDEKNWTYLYKDNVIYIYEV